MLKKNKKFINVFVLALGITVLFTACKKNDKNIQQPDAAGMMAFNLAADQGNIGFRIGQNIFTQNPLAFGNYTANYRPIYTGNRRVESFSYSNGAILDTATANIENDKYYSSFLFGRNGTYKQVVVKDALDTLPFKENKAYVRMVNAYTESNFTPAIVYTLSDNSQIASLPIAYAAVSQFVEVPAGEIKVDAKFSDETKSSRTINFEANKIYTLLLLDNASLDPTANPEIKFIVNGFIKP